MSSPAIRLVLLIVIGVLMHHQSGMAEAQSSATAKASAKAGKVQLTNAGTSTLKVRRSKL